MGNQHENQHQQSAHHPFADALQTALQTLLADEEAQHGDDHHPKHLLAGVGQRIAEHLGRGVGGQAGEAAGQKLEKVVQHPAGYRGVVHHQQRTADHAHPAVQVPLGAFRLQRFVGFYCAVVPGAAHGQLHGKHRHAHQHQKQQVEQHEHAAAVLPRYRGKAPHVANADRTAGADQDKTKAGSKALPLFARIHKKPLFLWYCRMGLQ